MAKDPSDHLEGDTDDELVAEPFTVTLVLRGPAIKDRFLVMDRATGRVVAVRRHPRGPRRRPPLADERRAGPRSHRVAPRLGPDLS